MLEFRQMASMTFKACRTFDRIGDAEKTNGCLIPMSHCQTWVVLESRTKDKEATQPRSRLPGQTKPAKRTPTCTPSKICRLPNNQLAVRPPTRWMTVWQDGRRSAAEKGHAGRTPITPFVLPLQGMSSLCTLSASVGEETTANPVANQVALFQSILTAPLAPPGQEKPAEDMLRSCVTRSRLPPSFARGRINNFRDPMKAPGHQA